MGAFRETGGGIGMYGDIGGDIGGNGNRLGCMGM